MNLKAKGTKAERELFHKFWDNNWACSRVAGSGSNKYPSPDLIAGNGARLLAIECKSTKNNKVYIPIREVDELSQYSSKIGAEIWIAVRFQDWYFVNIEDTERSEKNVIINTIVVRNKGLLFNELIGQFR